MGPNREKGQAILLMLVAIGIFLIGGVGLVVDVSQLYTHQQMAQVAADAAAQAAMLGIVQRVDTIGSATIASGYTCTTGTDSYIACQYARLNGFGSNATDTVKITYPSCGLGATICGPITPNEVQVSITRSVPNTFIRFVGAGASSTIGATAIAAAIQVVAPVPILIIHPTMDGSLIGNGTTGIAIKGGPSRSIQVNSSARTDAYGLNNKYVTLIDLSQAGPNFNGADFGVFGGPKTQPAGFDFGSEGKYDQPATPLSDPMCVSGDPSSCNISEPTSTEITNLAARSGSISCSGLSAAALDGVPNDSHCTQYLPGKYANGIDVSNNDNAIFQPGLYVMQNSKGFHIRGNAHICGGLRTDPNTLSAVSGCTQDLNGSGQNNAGDGMVVYNQGGDYFQITGNANAYLQGPPMYTLDPSGNATATRWAGILFFQDRRSPGTGNGASQQHQLGGGGILQLEGTIYITNTTSRINNLGDYQLVNYHGNPGSGTFIIGEIIVDALSIAGGSQINMQLSSQSYLKQIQVALIGGGPHP